MNIKSLKFITGGGDGKTTACLMSARALIDGRGLTDDYPSIWIRRIGIFINDCAWWNDDAERTSALLPIAIDERLCASRCDTSAEAETRRCEIFREWIIAELAPHTTKSVVVALKAIGAQCWANELQALKITNEASLHKAASWCSFVQDAANAAYTAAGVADATIAAHADAATAVYAVADAATAVYAVADAATYTAAYAAAPAVYAAAYAAATAVYAAATTIQHRLKQRRVELRNSAIAMFKHLITVGQQEAA